jgi:hypothetical protein
MTTMRPLSVRRVVSGASALALLGGSSALLFTALAVPAEAVTVSGVNCRTLSTTKPWNAPTTDEPTHSLPDITVSIGARSGNTVPVTVSYVEGPGIGPVSVPDGALQPAATLALTGATTSTALATGPAFGPITGTNGATTGISTRVPPATMTVNVTASGSGPVSVELQSIGFDYTPFSWPGTLGAVDTVCNKGADPFAAAAAPIGLTAAESGGTATPTPTPTETTATPTPTPTETTATPTPTPTQTTATPTPTPTQTSGSPTPTPTSTGVSASLTCSTLGSTQPWTATWSASVTGTQLNVAFVPGPANGPVPLNDQWLKATAEVTTPSTVAVEGAPYGALDAREIIPGTTMTGAVTGTPTTIGVTKVVFRDVGSGSNVDTTCMPNAAITVPVASSPPLPDTLPTSTGDLTVSPDTVSAGGTVTLSGSGFAAGSNATAGMYSDPVTLGVGTADATGAMSVQVTIPSGTSGSHTLILLGTDSSGGVVALTKSVTVTAVTSTPTPSENPDEDPDPDNDGGLPKTGPEDFAMTLLWGAVALQIGLIVAVRASRSRSTATAGKHRR